MTLGRNKKTVVGASRLRMALAERRRRSYQKPKKRNRKLTKAKRRQKRAS